MPSSNSQWFISMRSKSTFNFDQKTKMHRVQIWLETHLASFTLKCKHDEPAQSSTASSRSPVASESCCCTSKHALAFLSRTSCEWHLKKTDSSQMETTSQHLQSLGSEDSLNKLPQAALWDTDSCCWMFCVVLVWPLPLKNSRIKNTAFISSSVRKDRNRNGEKTMFGVFVH